MLLTQVIRQRGTLLLALVLALVLLAAAPVYADQEGPHVEVSFACTAGDGSVDFTATLFQGGDNQNFAMWAQYGTSTQEEIFLGSNWHDGQRWGETVTGTLFEPYGSNSPYDDHDVVVVWGVDTTTLDFLVSPSVDFNRNPQCGLRLNRAPTAQPVSGTMLQYEPSVTVTLKGSDLDGQPLNYGGAPSTIHGTTSVVDDQLTWTPSDPNWYGTETFSYTVTDGIVAEPTSGSVTITVQPRQQLTVLPPTFTPADAVHDTLATLVPPDTGGMVCYFLSDLTTGTGPDPMIGTQYLSEGRVWEWSAEPCYGVSAVLVGNTSGQVDTPFVLKPYSDASCYNAVCLPGNDNHYDVMFNYGSQSIMVPAGSSKRIPTTLSTVSWTVTKLDGTLVQANGSTEVKQFRPSKSISFRCDGRRHRAIMGVDSSRSTVPVVVLWDTPEIQGEASVAPTRSWKGVVKVRPPGKVRITAYWKGASPEVWTTVTSRRIPRACR